MTRIVFVDGVQEEVQDAARYYDKQMPGLGQDFLDEVQHTINRILAYPGLGWLHVGGARRRLMRRFPFGILYRVDPQEIVIIAVMHLRRRPGYWEGRD